MKSLILSSWLFLVAVCLAEQSMAPFLFPGSNLPESRDIPNAHFNPADNLFEFFILPKSIHECNPGPLTREPFFKWKSHLPENQIAAFITTGRFPEIVQDIWRCPAVAFVLFPYHEFL